MIKQFVGVDGHVVLVGHPAEMLRAERQRVELVPQPDFHRLNPLVVPGVEVFRADLDGL